MWKCSPGWKWSELYFLRASEPSGPRVQGVISLPAACLHAPPLQLHGQSMAPAKLWSRVRPPTEAPQIETVCLHTPVRPVIKHILQTADGAFLSCGASRCLRAISIKKNKKSKIKEHTLWPMGQSNVSCWLVLWHKAYSLKSQHLECA